MSKEVKIIKMKKIKLFLPILLIGIALVSLSSCRKCRGEDPAARIINNGTIKASVQIQTSGGNTVNINNVEPGTKSLYSSYAPGQVQFTISVDNSDYVETIVMLECFNYDIAIDANNVITTVPFDRNN